ncbi:MAG: AMP-binding protein [Eggerthellaceae bacterium]|nr:AMP-binding protein [Eggerthellaceae bacterium]
MSYILVTGITGFLGTEVASEIMETTDDTVFGLIRAHSMNEAIDRLLALWYLRPELAGNIGERIIPILGDVSEKELGLSEEDQDLLIKSVDYVIHTAALIGNRHTRRQFWDVNVNGTRNALDFAKRIQADHGLRRFSHISTAYVAGQRSGRIMEDSLVDAGFSSLYEQSKFEGERLAVQAMDEISVSVFRPGQIVGDSRTGYVKNFNTLYYPLKLYLKRKTRIFPINKYLHVNMVPVDYVADAVVRITYADDAAGKTFHLTAPYYAQPTVVQMVDEVRTWAKDTLSIHLPAPWYLQIPFLDRLGEAYNRSEEKLGKKSILTNMLTLAPYFTENKIFDTTNTESYMGPYTLDWRDYLPRLLDFAVSRNFLDNNSRTVYEQIRFCLKSRHSSIQYYDVTDSGIRERSALEVELGIEAALKSLQALGIGPGDRVAVSGINSVRYFVLDVAIGLAGATSVPLYYTTPPEELDELLCKSNASCFFIGDDRILSHADELAFDRQVISFMQDAYIPEGSRLMSWDEFLSLGKGRQALHVDVSYGDIATIRYTSGTTGNSKSVAFTHGQLRWMAETMGSLLSFKSRIKKATYLSFLPLSHVVEGILGAYAPYYLGIPVAIYFLNDFGKVAQELPEVRPTIFFSVPRFFEKVWDQLARTGAGKLYISTKNPLLKTILRPILRAVLLRKAGLDRCDQLIVGSAPVSEKLLSDFRGMGIEIHNAYGLTEAPLITLNRIGANDITTVGPPLPQTSVTLAEDGEILVMGPQVAAEYDGRDSDILYTGDFGKITENGHLQIIGRKKEILINSYGKNINLQNVETLLKDIPGISEAMLVGDERPYCVALLWPEDDRPSPDEAELRRKVCSVNEKLSHPEQVKRYAVMSEPLKIATGELTPNLKLRRKNIAELHKDTIEGLYAPEAVSAGSVLFTEAL